MTRDLSGCLFFCVQDVEILKRLKIHVSVSSAMFFPCSLAIGAERLQPVAIPIEKRGYIQKPCLCFKYTCFRSNKLLYLCLTLENASTLGASFFPRR